MKNMAETNEDAVRLSPSTVSPTTVSPTTVSPTTVSPTEGARTSAKRGARILSVSVLTWIGLTWIGLATNAVASEVRSEFGYPLESKLGETALELNGDGRLKYKWGIFKFHLYDAALYTSKTSKKHEEVLPDAVSKKLVLDFARSIDQEKMREAFSKSFELIATEERRKKHATSIEAFLKAVRAVDEEHRWIIATSPDSGLSLKIRDGKEQTFGDSDFAALFFELYLDPKAPNDGLRKDLLGL